MKKASSSFLILFFAAILVSLQSFAQVYSERSTFLREEVRQHLSMHQSLSLGDLLRLPPHQQNVIVLSVSLMAQSFRPAAAQIELLEGSRPMAAAMVGRQLQEVRLNLPQRSMLNRLEMSSASDVYVESITAEVIILPVPGHRPDSRPIPRPHYEQQVAAHSFISLRVNQRVYGHSLISLDQLARQQLGVTLSGAQIERVVIQGQPTYGRGASVQVELNRRPVGDVKYLSSAQRQLPLQVHSFEEVRSLALIVNGDADIHEVRIRVGVVRPQHYPQQHSQVQRIHVGQEVSFRRPLELSRLLGYEQRLIKAITVHARSLHHMHSQLSVLGLYGDVQGSILVRSSARARIQLRRPMAAHELRLEAASPVIVDTLEIEYDLYPRY